MRPHDEAVMADQAFVIYRMVVQVGGAPGSSAARLARPRGAAEAVTPRTRVVFLANPNNPTGTIFGRAAWEAFLAALPRHLVVVADDAYAEYVEDPEYPDTIRERGDGRVPVISLRTFSKLYGLAGLRVGYAVAPSAVIDAMGRVRQPFNVNALRARRRLAALDDGGGTSRGRSRCTARAWRSSVEASAGSGSRGCRAPRTSSSCASARPPRSTRRSSAAGVIVRPMEAYGFPEHLRVTVGLPEENGAS